MLIALLALAFAPAPRAEVSTIAELFARLEAAGAKTKAEVLAALPDEMKRNYVLIRDSRSRQKGTPELPRILHFTKNVELIASSSGHGPDDDFAANDLEVMELDRAQGTWRMGTIHFDGAKLSAPVYNGHVCLACHGENPRPLWGRYPNWPTAYGGDPANPVDTMGDKELQDFTGFLERAKTHEGYRHLELAPQPRGFDLPASTYAYPNSVFTARIGARHAEALFGRLSHAPLYPRLRHALIAASRGFCPSRPAFEAWLADLYAKRLAADPAFAKRWEALPPQLTVTKILRLLDSDPVADFALDHLPRGGFPLPGEEETVNWNQGGDHLLSLVDFLVLSDSFATDANVARLFASRAGELAGSYAKAFTSSAELLRLDQPGSRGDYVASVFPYVEDMILAPVLRDAALQVPACDYLTEAR